MADKLSSYSDSDIIVLEGLEAVRKRPGMYIGSTDGRGLHHLVWEILDNAIDEALAGFGKEINIKILNDNSIEIEDFGRGMPCGIHAKTGRPTTEVIFTQLHSGGKFGGGGYKVSGGLHGVGSSVVNALSEWLIVTSSREGKIHEQKFEKGGKIINPLTIVGETKKTGTKIWFKPDPTIFSTTLYNYETIKERVRESAFLIKNIKINLYDERTKTKETFQYANGIAEYVALLTQDKVAENEAVCPIKYFEGEASTIKVEVAFQYTEAYSEKIISFVNNVRTRDDGTHVVGFKSSLTKAINDYARKYSLLKEKEPNLDGADIREGITAIVSVLIPEKILEFEGQTKSKLGSPEARNAVESVVYEKLSYYLEENAEISKKIVGKAINAFRVREAARKARDDARGDKKKNKKEMTLSGKLSPAQGKNRDINELFIVEGDSAGGSAKQGRDRKFQAILPLRGKVLNTEKIKVDAMLKNEEIATMIYTIGADFGRDFDVKKSNYNKIIIMTDADTDGAHIQILLLTFFFRYMTDLIKAGKVYIALPPLYKVSRKRGSKKDEVKYAWTDEELKEITKSITDYQIQRYKGLGEMNADQLWETTMDPKSRTLIQVGIDDLSDADQRVSTLMGDNPSARREWIEDNVSFVVEDDFVISEGDK